MDKLRLDYLDLLLIHWPGKNKYIETWHAFEKLYQGGHVKTIGVSNFQVHHLQDIFENCTVKPMVDQIELHPYLMQHELLEFCKNNDILVEAWSPLMHGQTLLHDPIVAEIAKKHGRTPAQIILRGELQMGVRILPKSVHRERIIENISLFDFQLDDADMKRLYSLNRNMRSGPHPDEFYMDF